MDSKRVQAPSWKTSQAMSGRVCCYRQPSAFADGNFWIHGIGLARAHTEDFERCRQEMTQEQLDHARSHTSSEEEDESKCASSLSSS
ncbi:hypothetical protein KIN20_021741 [Parelaphostrongylus tenuis]|uniref:Uncharacterized protein n=1 Tax=Parelaphostrongylus tenuis TaxID=148309 RepID=A0AAD5MT42_PARTN|nr:hypothetical protein KIN20_021741 [Parelaphostrongylus tenuis]